MVFVVLSGLETGSAVKMVLPQGFQGQIQEYSKIDKMVFQDVPQAFVSQDGFLRWVFLRF